MFKKLKGLRYQMIRIQLKTIFFSLLIVALLLFFVQSVFQPEWLTVASIYLFVGSVLVVMVPVSIYTMYFQSRPLLYKIDVLSMYVSRLADGKYDARIIKMENEDEIDQLSLDLNDLAKKLENQVKSLQRLADEKSEYAQKASAAATMEERQRLARDLHDAVSQQLFALSMMSQATLKIMEKKPDQAKEQLEEIVDMALKAQNEMRALLLHLRPVQLSGEPLHKGIHRLVEELKGRSQIQFDLEISEELDLKPSVEEHLFRMIQEGISNVLRHANADQVSLHLTERPESILLYISDDGDGFDVESQKDAHASYGLRSMQERCEEIGGTFRVKSKVGQGTYIEIKIPKQGEEQANESTD